jgi:hypothetical protein
LTIGFHGCSKALADRVLAGEDDFRPSERSYDWLGRGIYFWERDPRRAYEFAVRKGCKEPSAVGALIYMGRCFDLHCREGLEMLRFAYAAYCGNVGCPKENASYEYGVPLRRDLDCAVIELACKIFSNNREAFDTVVGMFFEGNEVYPGSGMRDKTHTQICVRNSDCILGYFRPKGEKDALGETRRAFRR